METPKQKSGWSDEELEASVDAYLKMLGLEQSGQSFKKSVENKLLREGLLSKRSASSVEYRMQNISAVMEQLDLPRITGYVSAKNLGSGVIGRIKKILAMKDTDALRKKIEQATPPFSLQLAELHQPQLHDAPLGILSPKRTSATVMRLSRANSVKKWVLARSKGNCEGCNQPAPFLNEKNEPFLEVHHVKHLVDGGADSTWNTVALCPNCHRRCHHSSDRYEFTESLYKKVEGLKSK
jgi:5-methylcytosine-specific restriction protein A